MHFLLFLRQRGIADAALLRAMDQVPREHFIASDFNDKAYADQALPIACGQTISQPYVVAYMTEQLKLEPHHRVLEIGTGSGYQAAILSRLAREVVTVERYRTLAETARARLATLGYDNIEVRVGDGFEGAPDKAPYERIMVTAKAFRTIWSRSLGIPGSCCCRLGRTAARNTSSGSRRRRPALNGKI
jgi:protein-L-isoaspartate(D-aspartate) O-methyltransferase